jgi:hypothetical protein
LNAIRQSLYNVVLMAPTRITTTAGCLSFFKDLLDFRHAALQVGVVFRLDRRRDVIEVEPAGQQ